MLADAAALIIATRVSGIIACCFACHRCAHVQGRAHQDVSGLQTLSKGAIDPLN
jgi:hypothetical protein